MHPSGRFLVMRYRFLSACANVYQCLFRLRQCSPGRDAFCPSHRSSPNGDSPEPELRPATLSTGHDGYCGSLLSFRPAFLSKCSRRFSVPRKIASARVVLCHVATPFSFRKIAAPCSPFLFLLFPQPRSNLPVPIKMFHGDNSLRLPFRCS